VKTFVYVKKKAATNELKHEEIESADTCEYVEVIASISGVEVIIWLSHCATNRKVASSIPDGVMGIFYWYSLSVLTVALGSTQPLTEMSARNISWG
jgi:hypothetical protein